MKTYQTTAGVIALLAITSIATLGKTIPNYAEADLVLGQFKPNFIISELEPLPQPGAIPLPVLVTPKVSMLEEWNKLVLRSPGFLIVDPVSLAVFLSEDENHRVLRYGDLKSLADGNGFLGAFGSFGGAPLNTPVTGVKRNQFGGKPSSMFLDAKGRLWVADYSGNRVLMFESANRWPTSSANRVYGQHDFTTGTPDTTATKMSSPYDVCVDSADRLWVADVGNSRVLRFDSISTKPSGAAADGVLGQANFTTNTYGRGNNRQMETPSGVTISAKGTLYVTCSGGNRVMRFNQAASLRNGAPASAVLGQPRFGTIGSGTTATTMSFPLGAWITPDDSLWVTDSGNNRLLRFNNASTKRSGAAADGVLGQPDFTTRLATSTRRGMGFPYPKPFVDRDGSLWISDSDNNRILRYSPDTTRSVVTVTAPAKFTKKPKITIWGTASDASGISKVEYRVGYKGPFKLANGTTTWSFRAKLKKGRNTITLFATDEDGTASVWQIIKIHRM